MTPTVATSPSTVAQAARPVPSGVVRRRQAWSGAVRRLLVGLPLIGALVGDGGRQPLQRFLGGHDVRVGGSACGLDAVSGPGQVEVAGRTVGAVRLIEALLDLELLHGGHDGVGTTTGTWRLTGGHPGLLSIAGCWAPGSPVAPAYGDDGNVTPRYRALHGAAGQGTTSAGNGWDRPGVSSRVVPVRARRPRPP